MYEIANVIYFTAARSLNLASQLKVSGHVSGIGSSREELFITLQQSSDILVYNIHTLAFQRNVTVKGLINPWDIAVHANVLYASEFQDKFVHRIHLTKAKNSNWFVDSTELTLSITKEGNVVVTCYDLHTIIEYTTTGTIVRKIRVDSIGNDITIGVPHAIKLEDDQFLICHNAKDHNHVCIIDSNGTLMKSYGNGKGFGFGQLDVPCYLAIDENDFILVFEYYNNRITYLNSSLEYIKELFFRISDVPKPRRIHLHNETLYISQYNEKIVTIFNL